MLLRRVALAVAPWIGCLHGSEDDTVVAIEDLNAHPGREAFECFGLTDVVCQIELKCPARVRVEEC